VVVFTASGYDHKKREPAMANKRWHGIIALGKTRRVQSETLSRTPPKSRPGWHRAPFFRQHRRCKWTPLRVMTHGAQAQRMEVRSRDTLGYRRYVGKGQWVGSEPRKRPEGRRK
jgi:hypothetical protein